MTPLLSLDRVRRVLFVGAHSDDIEIGCGGTALRLLGRPDVAVQWVVLAAAGERADEARRSAEQLLAGRDDAAIEVLAFRERYFPHQPEIKEYFDDLGRRTTPDLVFAPRLDDLHQDHRTAGELAANTFRTQPILHYEIVKYDGDLTTPNVYVPLATATVDRKVSMILDGFPSQRSRPWFRAETFRALATIRGVECGAPDGLAEGFHARKLVAG